MSIEISDDRLLDGLKHNEAAYINFFYKKYYKMVATYVLKNKGSGDDAADIFQETLVVVYEKLQNDSFKLTSSLQTFVYAIAKKIWLSKLNRNKKTLFVDYSVEAQSPATADVSFDLAMHISKEKQFESMSQAMAKLGEPCKSLLEAYYIKKMSMIDIAQSFGYTNADNAKTQKYKCLLRLKKLFFNTQKGNDKA